SSVDLPIPGSPPMSKAEPGTIPPPVTRSSSSRPVGRRGAASVLPDNGSRATTRPREEAANPVPGGAGPGTVSSTRVFHSSQLAHFPVQRVLTAPQFWQTNVALAAFAISAPPPLPRSQRP